MRVKQRRERGTPSGRKLRFEWLEERSLLSVASVGEPIISDSAGHLFAVNVRGTTTLQSLGTMDQVMWDIGFLPSGTLLGVKQITNSGLVTSGLYSIPVNLENPSANVTTTLLGAITYNGGAVSLNSLDVRSDGTVFAAGTNSAGRGGLFVLNAGTSATVTATLARDLGSFVPAGDLTFDTAGNIYISTSSSGGRLLKVNSSLSTLTDLGPIKSTNFMGLSHGSGYTVLGFQQSGGVYTLNPTTAAPTLLTTLSGSGLTAIYGAAAVPASALSLGQVDLRSLASQQAYAGNLTYNFTAAHTGLLTVDLPNAASGTNVRFTLFSQDSAGKLTQVNTGSGTRVDWPVTAGQAYVLTLAGAPATSDIRLTNLVSVSGNTTTVFGTSGDDSFVFTAGSPYRFVIDGVSYPSGSIPATTNVVAFYGGSGMNTANLTGSAGAGVVKFSMLNFTGSYVTAGLEVDLFDAGAMSYTAVGTSDTASLVGTSHVDSITMSPRSARIAYGSPVPNYVQVSGVPTISVAGGGSADSATFTGGSQAFTATVNVRQADFIANDSSYAIHLTAAKNITAKAGSSGADVATMTGTTGADSLVSTAKYVSMFASTFSNACNGFSRVQAYGAGGEDSAQMSDSGASGTTQFVATPTQATMIGSTYRVEANQFGTVTAKKQSGKSATATLYGSSGNDTLTSTATTATLAGTGFSIRVDAFNSIYAESGGGVDTANMTGSSGNDTFVGRPDVSTLSGPSYLVQVKAFQKVYATAGAGGTDQAFLYDSAGVDLLVASGKTATFSDSAYPYLNQVMGFGKVTVVSTSGNDTKQVGSISYTLVLQGL